VPRVDFTTKVFVLHCGFDVPLYKKTMTDRLYYVPEVKLKKGGIANKP
jgi:hypothetical protein